MAEYTPSQLKGDFAIKKRLDGSRGNLIVENSITVGDYLIADADGLNLNISDYYATSEKPGLIKPGNALEVKPDGTLDFNGAIDGDVYIFGDGEEGGTATIEKSLTVGGFLIADENGLNADLLPIATTETKGIVKVGDGISVNNGTISLTITPAPASDFAEHVADQSAHGATSTPTADKIAKFNADGNLESGSPTEDAEVATRGFIAEMLRTTTLSIKAIPGAIVSIKIGSYSTTIVADADGFVSLETQHQGDAEIFATYKGLKVGNTETFIVYNYNKYEIDLEIPDFVLYGVRHYVGETSPALTRLADSENYVFTPENSEQFGSSSFDDKPIYSEIKSCVVVVSNDGELSIVYEDDDNFTRTPDAGDVCVEIPKFYYFRDGSHLNDETPYEDLYISNVKLNEKFLTSPSHMDRGDGVGERDKVYIGAYETNASYRSVSGSAVLRNTTISTARAGYNNRSSKIQEYDILDLMTVYMLYMIEVAKLNSQEAVGKGNAIGTGIIETGTTDSLFYCSGDSGGVKYRGIENLWSNILSYVAGVKVDSNRAVYICYISANETIDNSFDNYTNTGITISSTNGVINRMSFSESFPFLYIATGSGGSNTAQYYCDQMIATLPTGAAVFKTAGYYSNALLGGLFFSAYSRGVTSRDSGDGFRLHII